MTTFEILSVRNAEYQRRSALSRKQGICRRCRGLLQQKELDNGWVHCYSCRVQATNGHNGHRRFHAWTDTEIEIIRRDYRHTHRSRDELAARLGVTPAAVAGQIMRHGLAKRTLRRPWTAEEEDRLERLIGERPPGVIAKMMRRSVNSIVVKSKRLGLSRRAHTEWYTKREVCEIFGVDHKWVQARIDSGALKAEPFFPGSQPQRNGQAPWRISRKSVYDFLRRYPEELNGRNVDLTQVVEILAGLSHDHLPDRR